MTMDAAAPGAASLSHVVGVDVGGTKTRLMRSAIDGELLDDLVVASSSWRGPLGDLAADAAGLSQLVTGHFGSAGAPAAVVVGTHGCENTAQCRELESALRGRLAVPVRVVNDSELIAPAMGAEHAIGMVVGTGSIATARDEQDELVTSGGWGWILGDEGSAPALVREATRAVLTHLDAGHPVEALGRRLMAAFAASDGDALALTLTQATSPDDWGRHAPDVFAAAEEGSTLAARVISDAGAALAGLVDRLLRRGVRADVVVAGGSVIENQPLLQEALRHELARVHPDMTLTILDTPPVMGALSIARKIAEAHEHTHENGKTST